MLCQGLWKLGVGLLAVLVAVLPVNTNSIPLEAAFQGRCEDGNPCDQKCFNIHNEMYECDCREGFILAKNGYNCLVSNESDASEQSPPQSPHHQSTSAQQSPAQSQLNIQIEVDIDPPPHQASDPSDEELERLGLPTHHVHYSTAPGGAEKPNQNRPKDYKPEDSLVLWTSSEESSSSDDDNGDLEPPRALPLGDASYDPRESKSPRQGWAPSQEDQGDHDGDHGDQEEGYRDRVYEIDAFCNLDCGVEGECFMSRDDGSGSGGDDGPSAGDGAIRKRCLCPHGKYGEKCASDLYISSPKFSGHSYLALPTLTNAYSDLQLNMEFRPEFQNGVLLLTGESNEMTGDYLSLLLRDGHVELRLDCGTGPGIVRTREQVHLHHWNRLTVFRHDWGVWLQLNDGFHEEGRSKGLFSRITFAQPVVLGGTGSFRNTGHFLDTDAGFKGCIRRLEINNKIYSFEPAERQGDAMFGLDIDECPEDSCSSVPCQNNGVCVPPLPSISGQAGSTSGLTGSGSRSGGGTCQCPLGFGGQFCEQAIDVKIPFFNGTSHLTYFGLGESSLLWTDLELVLKPESPDGIVLYNGDNNDGTGDFFTLFLAQGFVEFAFDNGDAVTVVRSQFPISLHNWHTIHVSRTGSLAFLDVDEQSPQSQQSQGTFTELSLDQNLYLGGVPTLRLVSPYVPVKRSFKGCVQKLTINNLSRSMIHGAIAGVNVSPCPHPCSPLPGHASPCGLQGQCQPQLEDYACECPLGKAGVTCEKTLDLDRDMRVPSFGGDSFLYFKGEDMANNVLGNTNALNLRLRVVSENGLILWTGGDHFSPVSDYLLLGVQDGYLEFRFNLGNGEGVLTYNQTRIDDGRWHRVRASRTEQTASLKVDNGHIVTGASPGKLRQLNGNGDVFIGGTEDLEHLPVSSFRQGLIGCISEVNIGRLFNLDLLHRAAKGQNVEDCAEAFDDDDESERRRKRRRKR